MTNFIQQLITALTTSPGNLTYHLVLAFSVAGAWLAYLIIWRKNHSPQYLNKVIGLGVILFTRLVIYLAAGLLWKFDYYNPAFIFTIDRGITTISLVVFIWLWLSPQPVRIINWIVVLVAIFTLPLTGLLYLWGIQTSITFFNGSLLDLLWQGIALIMLSAGLLVIVIQRTSQWELGLGALLLLFFGHLAQVLFPLMDNNLAGSVRLMELVAYPMLLLLPQSFSLKQQSMPQEKAQLIPEGSLVLGNQELLSTILSANFDAEITQTYQVIARLLAQALRASLCLIITPDNNGNFLIMGLFEPTKSLASGSLELQADNIPLCTSAFQQGKSIRLPSDSSSIDSQYINQLTHQESPASIMAAPISSQESGLLAGVILVASSAEATWDEKDELVLRDLIGLLAKILLRSQQTSNLAKQLSQIQKVSEIRQAEIESLQQKIEEQTTYIQQLQNKSAFEQARAETLAALVNAHEKVLDRPSQRERLTFENQVNLSTPSEPLPLAKVKELAEEYRLTLEEVAWLRSELSEAKLKIMSLETVSTPPPQLEDKGEVIASIAQELRQPMASVVGYTELILNESVGILGALQRKFLERIKAAIERMRGLVEDMVRITSLAAGPITLTPQSVNLTAVIDEAIAFISSQIREKNITLRINFPDQLPQLQADHDALQQIFFHLLQNACLASMPDSEIALNARIESDEVQDYILVQITDQGGGIPPVDLTRVFSRLYRADNTLIQGVGDTGVGLSIVKTLVEAHGGRVWVDSEPGIGSTFSVLIPLVQQAYLRQEPAFNLEG